MDPVLPSPPTGRYALPISRSFLPLALLLAAFAVWAGWFIFRTSFTVDGRRIFSLFDDAMISMTYARNLVEGHGLNWARHGAPVEGFTHPLWTAVMVPVNLLPLDLRDRSLVVQIVSLALLLAHLALVHRLVRRHYATGRAAFALPAAVLTAAFYPLNYWSLMGMETALQALLVTGSVLLALDVVELGRDRHLALWGLAALAVLLRLDMLLPVLVVQAFVLAGGGLRRGRRSWLLGLGLFLAAVLGYQTFRWLYFGDLLPNTYYLKLTGVPLDVRLLRGLSTLTDFARAQLPLLLAVVLGTLPLLGRRLGPPVSPAVPAGPDWRRRLALPLALFAVGCAYSVWVGGDVWEMSDNVRANRFIVYLMPQLFVLANALLNLGLDALERRREKGAAAGEAGAGGSLLARYLAAGATVAALLLSNGLVASERAPDNWANLAVTNRPLHIISHELVYRQLLNFQKLMAPDALVAGFWAGIPAYFSDYRMIDLLGYNDRRTARLPSRVVLDGNEWARYVPGHNKWDNDYVIEVARPDAFFQTWGIPAGVQPSRILRRAGYRRRDGFWVRKDSTKVRGDWSASALPPPPAKAGPC